MWTEFVQHTTKIKLERSSRLGEGMLHGAVFCREADARRQPVPPPYQAHREGAA